MAVIVAGNQAVALKETESAPALRKLPSGDFEYALEWTINCEPNVGANYLSVMSENEAKEIETVAGCLEVSLVMTSSPKDKNKAQVNLFLEDEEGTVDILKDLVAKTPSKMVITVHYSDKSREFDGRMDAIGCWLFKGDRLNCFEAMEIMNQDPTDFKVSILLDFEVAD